MPDVTALPIVVREIYTIRLAPNMRHKFSKRSSGTLASIGLAIILGYAPTRAQENRPVETGAGDRPPYNIVFVISDQRSYRLFAGGDYSLPALDAMASHGVSFNSHYIASAMCSPSRASFLTGQPPQIHHVFDQMEYAFTPTLDPDLPNMGSVLKGLGYKTAYFGKFEMDKGILEPKPTMNYSGAIQPYGFDVFSAGGDIGSSPQSGFDNDPFIAGESVRWLRQNANHSAGAASRSSWLRVSSIPMTSCTGTPTSQANPRSRRRSHRKRCRHCRQMRFTKRTGPSRSHQACRNRLPAPPCQARYWNTKMGGTVGLASSPPIARKCGASSTTTISMPYGMRTAL